MAKRLLTAAIAIPLGIVVIILNIETIYYIAMTAFSVIAVFELLAGTKYLKSKTVLAVSLLFSALVPYLYRVEELRKYNKLIYFGFVLIIAIIMLAHHEKIRFEQMALVSFVSLAIPLSLSSIAFVRTSFPKTAAFLITYLLLAVWVSDAGAYFIGSAIGKHKMCPKISPKKSWEGFFGGIVTSALSAFLACIVYEYIDKALNQGVSTVQINYTYLICFSLLLSVIGVLGDLTASIIKRECSIKDFGNFFPGHGGILDRFDSLLYAAPLAFMMFQMFPPVIVVS